MARPKRAPNPNCPFRPPIERPARLLLGRFSEFLRDKAQYFSFHLKEALPSLSMLFVRFSYPLSFAIYALVTNY